MSLKKALGNGETRREKRKNVKQAYATMADAICSLPVSENQTSSKEKN